MNELETDIEKLLFEQKNNWKLAKDNYASLANVKTRVIEVGGYPRLLQFNPERIRSSAARIDQASLKARTCFFCFPPDEQQNIMCNYEFDVLVNPYPIFEHHLTIPLSGHERQCIRPFFENLLLIASRMPHYFVFYNGPKSGASVPDHMHFQAGKKGSVPLMNYYEQIPKTAVRLTKYTTVYLFQEFLPATFMLVSNNPDELIDAFNHLYIRMKIKKEEYEPMMNIMAWKEDGLWSVCIFPRRELRPSCFHAEGDKNILISPATVEMAGLFVVPLEKDFEKVTAADLETILREVCLESDEMERIMGRLALLRYEEK